jgi:hypothetical protein
MTSWIKQRARSVGQLLNYVDDLEARHKYAVEKLSKLAQGYVVVGTSGTNGMQALAGNALEHLEQMQKRPKPDGVEYWSVRS